VPPVPAPAARAQPATRGVARARPAAKLSFKEKKELEALPAAIEKVEADLRVLEAQLASAEFYREAAATVRTAVDRLEALQEQLKQSYARWTDLEARASGVQAEK